MDYNLNNTYVTKALALGRAKGARQLVLAELEDGGAFTKGDLDKRRARDLLDAMILKEDAEGKDWLVEGDPTFPKLPTDIVELFKTPAKVKSAVSAALTHVMKKTKTKLGRGTFLGWHYPIEKVYMVYTEHLLQGLPTTFTLSQLIDWEELQGVSIANGRLSALKKESGVKSWLAVCKILLNFLFLVVGHDPATWLDHQEPSSAPVKTRKKKGASEATPPAAKSVAR